VKTYKVEYSSNNSGGSWWLGEKEWLALEAAGWAVSWRGGGLMDTTKAETLEEAKAKGKGFLGAYATDAHLDVEAETPKEALGVAIKSWEKVTAMQASEDGCNCCGAPHSFSTDDEYASGEGVLSYIFEHVPGSLRDACK
jgi:hypothetical protein